ncbi:hypothetical protein [Natrinema ejinorense]|uniref:hypothetical protein n=1 Tax=Natrinema ejinorense TaxID=373386 RepID=UPI00147499DF|nr:hypothetical protein [Natrinema ejinorense]
MSVWDSEMNTPHRAAITSPFCGGHLVGEDGLDIPQRNSLDQARPSPIEAARLNPF